MIQIKFFTPPPPPFLYSMLSVEAVPTHAAHKLTKKPLAHCHIRTPIFATKYRIPVYVWPKKKEKKKNTPSAPSAQKYCVTKMNTN